MPERTTDPHLLSPYNSLWHIQVPASVQRAATTKWVMKGASLARTKVELGGILAVDKNSQGKAAKGVHHERVEDKHELSLEEAREAERLRVERKRKATQ
eukprot:scaffold648054_cov39-Prasinocladus_malaysianus.AAC.1